MPPQITCPHCGSTINLENRKEVDFEKIMHALSKSPKTFTELLAITSLPRKTLSLRLKDLCSSGSIVKDGGYHLNSSIKPTNNILGKRNGNGKMIRTMPHIGKNAQWIPVALIACLIVVAFGSAMIISPPAPSPKPATANFYYAPSSNIVPGRTLTFVSTSNGLITNYQWDFGDSSPTVYGKIVTHAYAAEGVYTVILMVKDAHGSLVSAQGTVDVSTATVDVSTAPTDEPEPIQPMPATKIYAGGLPAQYVVGDTVTLSIMISNVTDLYTWQAGMTFNPSVLKCITTAAPNNTVTDATRTAFIEGSFLKSGGSTWWVTGELDNNAGVISIYGCSLYGADAGVTGSGVLLTVSFNVIGEGPLNIHLTDVALFNSVGAEIPVYVAS
jgi:PKD repeat protein